MKYFSPIHNLTYYFLPLSAANTQTLFWNISKWNLRVITLTFSIIEQKEISYWHTQKYLEGGTIFLIIVFLYFPTMQRVKQKH